ncbi:MAG: class I SAM-dependent methyltransferase [Parasphingorhabdus sp.]|uniref:class I SAM-dependent methyltransferase n=1 Tax=Parasphingorhabdus sp. TaxID=2709688 RepID=UPI003299E9D6
MTAKYDSIGINYSELRKPDLRIATLIDNALGAAETVLNVGAGTGSYEPTNRNVTALEPSAEMINQRDRSAAPAIQGYADDLPFDDNQFDASMAILTIHHWPDKKKGLQEMRRVTRGAIILLTFDPSHRGSWLTDYLPELVALDEAQMPAMSDYARWLGDVEIVPVPIPHDCTDGFLYAYWRRPAAYLDARIRAGSSSFWAIENAAQGINKLAEDLENGEWERRYADILALDAIDAGYRLVIAA